MVRVPEEGIPLPERVEVVGSRVEPVQLSGVDEGGAGGSDGADIGVVTDVGDFAEGETRLAHAGLGRRVRYWVCA